MRKVSFEPLLLCSSPSAASSIILNGSSVKKDGFRAADVHGDSAIIPFLVVHCVQVGCEARVRLFSYSWHQSSANCLPIREEIDCQSLFGRLSKSIRSIVKESYLSYLSLNHIWNVYITGTVVGSSR